MIWKIIDMQSNSLDFAKAIADETRQKIMGILCCRWLNVTEIVDELGEVTQPTVSHHLAILRDSGLVEVRPEGRQTYYTLNQNQVAQCCGRLIQVFAPGTPTALTIQESNVEP